MPIAAASLLILACGGLRMQAPVQGLYGTFTTYGPPPVLIDCAPMVTQADKDSCGKQNLRMIEEPLRSAFLIRNVGTRESIRGALDAQGSYRVKLAPGTYEFCLQGECGDPLEVGFGAFTAYGQRLPRPAADSLRPGVEAAKPPP